jgi:anti-sigma regulatory factor (Ser/Thr protein kinase)
MQWEELRAQFQPISDSVALARRLTRPLRDELPAHVADCVELVVSELATNAVRHAATPYEVAVRVFPTVRVEVSDASPDRPAPARDQKSRPNGRGLLIVDKCAERWGVDALPHGKVVWAEVR